LERSKLIFVEIEGLGSIHKVLSRIFFYFSQSDKRNINSHIIMSHNLVFVT
jgi:hypothetical protein